MLAHLPRDRYEPRDIYIDKRGVWHDRGRPVTPDKLLRLIDVALIGLHGEYGEDGQVQRVLEQFGIPYAGADSFGSYQAMHKVIAKMKAKEAGLLTPDFVYIERAEDAVRGASEAHRRFLQPVVVKPVAWGSSVGVSIVGGHFYVLRAIEQLFADGAEGVLVEELIRGKEATAGVVEGMRGDKLYALPTIEIIPPEKDFFSYEAKYSGTTREVCPGNFSRVQTEELKRAAKVAHRALGLRHYSRSDFIVSPRGIYYLETNSLPGLTTDSLVTKALPAVGISFPDFLSHLVESARR